MRLGIDASNLRSGGSLTHISELLTAARPERHGVSRVFVWGGRDILRHLPKRRWLERMHEPMLDGPLPARVWWQQTRLSRLAANAGCDLLFVPGGTYLGDFRPFVTMSRNMLPFDLSQVRLYGASPLALKFLLLRMGQERTLRNASGTIFLDDYARSRVLGTVGELAGASVIIPHGVSGGFRAEPREQKELGAYSRAEPFRLLYVSMVDAYKHQWHVAEAVTTLVHQGVHITLELVGPARPALLKRLQRTVSRLGAQDFIRYRGPTPYAELPAIYSGADAFVFASSCENLPNTLLEAMNAGLPIACSNRAPMPKILGDGGVYFDPTDPDEIAAVLHQMLLSPQARERHAARAFERARLYTWARCADETLAFLKEISLGHRTSAAAGEKWRWPAAAAL